MKLIDKVRNTASRLKTMGRRPPRKVLPQKLQARVRAAVAATADAYDDEEPQTKLTSAFVVVLILHVVAVGGIYAFNQIKASRRSLETSSAASAQVSAKTAPATDSVDQVQKQSAAPAGTAATVSTAVTPAALPGTSRQRVHSVKPGDTLNAIAKIYGTSVAELKTFNSLPNDSIRQGQTLNIPAQVIRPGTDTAIPKKTEPVEAKPSVRTYTVKSGDRLIFIAKKFNVLPEDLIQYNKITDPTKLQIGQTLKIPVKK